MYAWNADVCTIVEDIRCIHVRGGLTGSKVTIGESRATILYMGVGFCCSLPFINDFLAYHLADFIDLGQ